MRFDDQSYRVILTSKDPTEISRNPIGSSILLPRLYGKGEAEAIGPWVEVTFYEHNGPLMQYSASDAQFRKGAGWEREDGQEIAPPQGFTGDLADRR